MPILNVLFGLDNLLIKQIIIKEDFNIDVLELGKEIVNKIIEIESKKGPKEYMEPILLKIMTHLEGEEPKQFLIMHPKAYELNMDDFKDQFAAGIAVQILNTVKDK